MIQVVKPSNILLYVYNIQMKIKVYVTPMCFTFTIQLLSRNYYTITQISAQSFHTEGGGRVKYSYVQFYEAIIFILHCHV